MKIFGGRAARLSGELEELLAGWRILVGPRDSSKIPDFVKKVLKREELST
ncbi:MAG: hypothetical protein QW701_03515 [Candidatus Nezhaarchaeales archaeon]